MKNNAIETKFDALENFAKSARKIFDGNESLSLAYAQIKVLSVSGTVSGGDIFFGNLGTYLYKEPLKTYLEKTNSKRLTLSPEESTILKDALLSEGIIDLIWQTDFRGECHHLITSGDKVIEDDVELCEFNIEMLKKYQSATQRHKSGEITSEELDALLSKTAEDKIYVLDWYYGESHYGSSIPEVFYCSYYWCNPEKILRACVVPQNNHLVEAMKQVLSEEDLQKIHERAVDIKIAESATN